VIFFICLVSSWFEIGNGRKHYFQYHLNIHILNQFSNTQKKTLERDSNLPKLSHPSVLSLTRLHQSHCHVLVHHCCVLQNHQHQCFHGEHWCFHGTHISVFKESSCYLHWCFHGECWCFHSEHWCFHGNHIGVHHLTMAIYFLLWQWWFNDNSDIVRTFWFHPCVCWF
jgi:hypothetical protein